MELRQLEYFAELAERCNFRGAARALGISQPTLSQQLKTLEHELGILLMARNQHSVRLTPAGQAFLPRVRDILARVSAARGELADMAASSAQITVGTFGSERITRLVAEFAERHPETDLVVQQQSYQQMMKLLASRRLDLGLLQVHPRASHVPAAVHVEHLSPLRIGLLMRPDHPLAQKEAVAIEDLRTERLILPSAMSAPHVAIELVLRNAGITLEKTPYLSTATATMASLVAQGLGIGAMAEVTVSLVSQRLVFRHLDHPDAACWIGIAWASDARLSPAMEAFIRFAQAWRWAPRRRATAAVPV